MGKDAAQLLKEGFKLIQDSNNTTLWQKGVITVRIKKAFNKKGSDNEFLVRNAIQRANKEESFQEKGWLCNVCGMRTETSVSMLIHYEAVHPQVEIPNQFWRDAGALPPVKPTVQESKPMVVEVETRKEAMEQKKARLFIDPETRTRMKRIICDMTRAGKDRSEISDELTRQGIRHPRGPRIAPSDVGTYLQGIEKARAEHGLPPLREEATAPPMPTAQLAVPPSVQLMLDDPSLNDAKKLEVIRLFVKLPPSIELVLSDPDVSTAKKMEVLALFGRGEK